MKRIIIIVLCLQTVLFAQENPWENKSKENPWGTTAEKSENPETPAQTEKESSDTVHSAEWVEPDNADVLYAQAKQHAIKHYKTGRDFAVGFASGLLLNGYGTAVDAIYMIPYNEAEKEINDAINNDSTYVGLNDEKLDYQTRRTLKNRKFGAAVGGTVLGSLTQIAAIFGYILLV